MPGPKHYMALDVGTVRIGVAVAESGVRIAMPYDTIEVDGSEVTTLLEIAERERVDTIVVGYPRNQSGEATQQTVLVEEFVRRLDVLDVPIVYQDESLTSVMAEERLKAHGRPYSKDDIDAQAAAIILQDYLEAAYAE